MSDLKINNITDRTGGSGPVIAGVSTVSSTGAFTVPVGPTEYRGGRGRAVVHCGGYPSFINTLNFIEITTTGNAQDFGDAISTGYGRGSFASSTRSVIGGGSGPSYNFKIEYVTISSGGGGNEFGSTSGPLARRFLNGASNNTRGVFMGGHNPNASPAMAMNIIDFVEIATTGNATDFGDLNIRRSANGCCSSPIRGYTVGSQGSGPAWVSTNTIEYVTFSTRGNGIEYGSLSVASAQSLGGCSNATRGLFGGGNTGSITNVIHQITLTTSGTGEDFGDLTYARTSMRGTSNSVRGLFVGGYTSPAERTTIDYVNIASAGNAILFGDITGGGYKSSSSSDSHGGIG